MTTPTLFDQCCEMPTPEPDASEHPAVLADMITVAESHERRPDCVEYRAKLSLEAIGFLEKGLTAKDNDQQFQKLCNELISSILQIVNKEVIDKLEQMRVDLHAESLDATFEAYKAKTEAASKIGKLIAELRGLDHAGGIRSAKEKYFGQGEMT